jgi:hypothetical protein
MPIYSIQAPNGKTYQIEGPAGASQDQVIAEVLRQNPDAGQVTTAESGFLPALKAGVSGLKSSGAALLGRTGIMDAERAKEVMAEEEAYQQRTFKPTETFGEAPLRKTAELLGGSLPYMAAPLAAGVAGAAAPIAGAGIGAAGLASLAQFTGTNLGRQVQEGKDLEKTNLGAAAAAAVPQAALDMLSFKMAPGIRGIFAAAGKDVPEQVAAQIAKQGTSQMAKDYALATGKAMGAEGVTEAGQQFLERLQAGLKLTDEQARDEYWQSLIGGAVLGGAIAPAGRYVERGRIQTEQETEARKKQRDERAALALEQQKAADAEAARKLTPEYALDIEKQYLEAEQQRAALKAQLKQVAKDSPTAAADRAFNKDLTDKLKEASEAIKPLAKEYNAVQPTLATAKEQQRMQAMSPEDIMLEQTMQGGKEAAPAPTGGRLKGALGLNEAPEAAPVDTTVQDYAAQQVQAAKEAGQFDLASLSDYLLENPKLAARAVAERPALEGLAKADTAAVYTGLKLRLQEREKQAAAESKAELAARQEDLKAQKMGKTVDQMAMFKSSSEQVEEQRAAGETNFDYLDPVFEKAVAGKTSVVDVNPEIRPSDKNKDTRARVDQLTAQLDTKEQEYYSALRMNLGDKATKAYDESRAALDELNKLKAEGNPYASEVFSARKNQETALNDIEDSLDQIRSGNVLGGERGEVSASTKQTLLNRADQARAQYITSVLQEAATHRRAAGEQALTQDEALKAAIKMDDTVKEWMDRVQAAPRREALTEVTTPAQMRGTEIVRGAQTRMADLRPLEKRRFGAYPQAVAVLKEQLDNIRTDLSAPAKAVATKESPLLKTQFASTEAAKVAEARGEKAETLGGELRKHNEYVRNMMAKLDNSVITPRIQTVLNQAADVMDDGKPSRALLNAVEEVVGRLNSGRKIEMTDLRAIVDAIRASDETAPGQKSLDLLFEEPGQPARGIEKDLGYIRANAKNFANAPKVLKNALNNEEIALKRWREGQQKLAEEKAKRAEEVAKLKEKAAAEREKMQKAYADRDAMYKAQNVMAAKLEEKRKLDAEKEKTRGQRLQEQSDAFLANKEVFERQAELKRLQVESLQDEMADAREELATKGTTAERKKELAQKIQSLQAQLDVLGEGKPRRKQAAATVKTEISRAKDTPFRTGSDKTSGDTRIMSGKEFKKAVGKGVYRTQTQEGAGMKEQAVAKLADKIVADWENIPEVKVVADESQLPAHIQEQAKRDNMTGKIPGLYDTESGIVYLVASNLHNGNDVALTVAHEVAGHFGLRSMLGDKYASTMNGIYDGNPAVRAAADAKMKQSPNLSREVAVEEVLAEKAEEGGLSDSKFANAIRRVMYAIKQWFAEKFGIKNVSDKEVEQLVANARRFVKTGLGGQTSKQTAAPAAPTSSEAFKKWFGGSKIVDDNGKPLQVYHGTSEDFEEFSATAKPASGAYHGKGFYFGDAAMAQAYAGEKAPQIMPVYLRMENPFTGALTEKDVATLRNALPDFSSIYDKASAELDGRTPSVERLGVISGDRNEYIQKVLKTAGYDGRIVRPYEGASLTDPETEFVVFEPNQIKSATGNRGTFSNESGSILYRAEPTYANDEMAAVGALTDKFVAKQKGVKDRVLAAAGGFLGLETQLVDRFAGFERLSKTMDALKGSQMMYYMRMYDQRMNFVSQAVENGALKLAEKERADGQKEYVIEATPGASIKGVVEILNEAKPMVGNGEAINRLFTMYMSGIRAKSKGFASLNFGKDVNPSDLDAAMKAVDGNAELKEIFGRAREEYNQYNRDMMDFLASTGAISEQTRNDLVKENDYIPWYRENNGIAELMIGGESRIRIGSIAEQPYLHELVGGDRPILDFMTSSVQNTNMLADMGLRNLAAKNAIFELVDMDMAKIVGASTGNNIVKFKVDGKDKYASVETDSAGVPGDLLVKGMQGIPTQMPAIFRLMSIPSRLLRKGVTLSPLYAAKQLFRDSLAAPILSGADFKPVFGALKEINQPSKELLERRGITGGQVFTGTSEDLTKILRDITDGKSGWLTALAKAEAIGMEADALTRRAQYNSYIQQGLSEMEATLMALESMNFNKRGASPSIHIIGAMIPFFNAQIQGLNVLYKAMTGNMPFNERLKIQEKMLMRGGMLAAGTLAYAAMMQDDEAYKNATPEQKYGNWFVRIPGVTEPVRIPVPFEVGYIFKALPEALYNTMADEHGGEEAVKAFKQILLQTIPGGTSYGIPQALKPAIEAGLGKSFYTGRDILSSAEKSLLPEEQFRVNTSEAAKLVGKGLGVSPVILEQLVQGYTGPMGLAFLQAASLGVPKGNTPEQATKRLSELPLVGGAFQPNDAGGIINATYDRFEDSMKVQRTVDKLFQEGRQAEAKELLQKTGNEYAAGEMGDYFASQMKELTQYERAVQAMAINPDEKRQRLDEIKKLKIALAATARQTVDRTAPR